MLLQEPITLLCSIAGLAFHTAMWLLREPFSGNEEACSNASLLFCLWWKDEFSYLLWGWQNTGAGELVEQLMWCAPELLVSSRGFSSCAFGFFSSLFSSLSTQVLPVQAMIAAPMSQLISRIPLHSGLTQARQHSSHTDGLSATENRCFPHHLPA